MSKIKVLIVDDSTVVRRFLSDAVAGHPGLEVVGTASHGALAVQKVALLSPQIVTMDIEMPEMSGLQALAAIRRTHPGLPIIMVSTLTERGASATLEALSLGATDYVTKPTSLSGTGAVQRDEFIKDLLAKLLALGAPREARVPRAIVAPQVRPAPTLAAPRAPARIDVVAIGVSTGGPNALAALMPGIPADFPVPIVIVQHMPPLFTKLLADRLNAKAPLEVREGVAGDRVVPGMAFIAPGNYHMVVERRRAGHELALNQDPPENSCRPAVDVMFRSISDCFGPAVLAVVMTGMGQDGLRGCELIRERGGQILVQDEKTSVVWGMPGFVAEAGLADQVLALDRLAPAIVRRVREGRPAPVALAGKLA
jgi:two-component system, chemotaxis family, protein-glutamate methylesterase/glutaminase